MAVTPLHAPDQLGRLTRLQTLNTARTKAEPRPRVRPRGLPPALEPHGVYAASGPAEAALFGRDLLGVHRVIPLQPDRDFSVTFHGVLIRDVTLGYLEYSAAASIEVADLAPNHLVLIPALGTAVVASGGAAVVTSPVMAALPQPSQPATIEFSEPTAFVVVRIDAAAMALHLARVLGRTVDHPLEFDVPFDLSTSPAARWNLAIQALHTELYDDGSLLHGGVGLGQLEEFVMSSLLYAQPSNFTALLSSNKPPARRIVREARDFIERHLGGPLTVGDIAAAVGTSVRTLQSQFRDDLGQTPMGYLANRRLERVREDLADAAPSSGLTVTDIAARWGFTHLGRFATSYRARFGESPSQTLRA
ncbi:MAG TPA: AraC family transcriptional regulator [Ilumatobacter sp.]|nr:AraC family transcriptional regulator [Ilumatobacter sp.]